MRLTGPVQVFVEFFSDRTSRARARMTARYLQSTVCLVLLIWTSAEAGGYDPVSRMNAVLKDDASLKFYAHCFLDKGPCSGDARAIKRLLPDFVATSCGRCSERQKVMACKVIFTLQQRKYIDLWNEFLMKYDPKEQYRANLSQFTKFCTDELNIRRP